jgi:NAD-dependent DNA ligase
MAKTIETDEQRFVRLGWWIIEQKCRYYHLKRAVVSDEEYDAREMEYKALADKLGKDPTASRMVGFDITRASCRLVLQKLMENMNGQS